MVTRRNASLLACLLAFAIHLSYSHAWITSVAPLPSSMTAQPDANISVVFTQAIDPASLVDSAVVVWGHMSGLHARSLSYDPGAMTLTIDPSTDLIAGEQVDVTLTPLIRSAAGTSMPPFLWTFETSAASGSGSFDVQTLEGRTPGVAQVMLHDFTMDGIVDIEILDRNQFNSCMAMYAYPGLGTWPSPDPRITSNWLPRSLAVGELDRTAPAEFVFATDEQEDLTTVMTWTPGGVYWYADPIHVGPGASRVQMEDLNGDGLSDIIVNYETLDTVRVFMGIGDRKADPVGVAMSVHAPSFTIAADPDLDGDQDLLMVQRGTNALRLYTNTGAGSFGGPTDIATGSASDQIAVADMNKDGWPDLLAVSAASNTVSVFLSQSGSSFAPAVTYPTGGTGSAGLLISDWNADGRPEAAVINAISQTVSMFLCSETGVLTRQAVITLPRVPAAWSAVDWDRDGDTDILILNELNTEITFLSNRSGEPRIAVDESACAFGGTIPDSTRILRVKIRNAGGTSDLTVQVNQPADQHFTVSPSSLTIAPDDSATVLVAFTPTAVISYASSLVLSHNDPLHGPTAIPLSGYGVAVRSTSPHTQWARQSGDLRCTIAFSAAMDPATLTDSSIVVYGTRSGRHHIAGITPVGGGESVAFDITGTLFTEEAVTVTLTRHIRTAGGNAIAAPYAWTFRVIAPGGTGVFSSARLVYEFVSPVEISAGDLDRDADVDLCIQSAFEQSLDILFDVGVGWYPMAGHRGYGGASAGDLAGDGGAGTVYGDWTTAYYAWWYTDPWTGRLLETRQTLGPLSDFAFSSMVSDLDGNGLQDALYCVFWKGQLETFWNDGAMHFTRDSIFVAGSPIQAAPADLNGDGLMDLVVAAGGHGDVVVLKNTGGGSFTEAGRFPAGPQVLPIVVADFNRDGRVDIASGASEGNVISVLSNRGDFRFDQSFLGVAGKPRDLVASDLNGDGYEDLAAVTDDTGLLTIWLNDREGWFAETLERKVGAHARGILAVDRGNDGRSDLLVTADGYLLLFENMAPVPEIEVPENVISFPNISLDSAVTTTFNVWNIGGAGTLHVTGMAVGDPAFTVSVPSIDVPNGAMRTIGVTFTPRAPHAFRDSLVIVSDAAVHPRIVIPVYGTGMPVRSVTPLPHGRIRKSGDSIHVVCAVPIPAGSVTPGAIAVRSGMRSFPASTIAAATHVAGSDVVLSGLPPFVAGEEITVTLTPRFLPGADAPGSPYLWSFRVDAAQGTPALRAAETLPSNYGTDVCFADVNGDSHPDLVTISDDIAELSVFANNGGGGFRLIQEIPGLSNCAQILAADVDTDGDMDLVLARTDPTWIIMCLINDGTGTFNVGHTTTISGYQLPIFATDWDADGDMDVLFSSNDLLSALENDGTGSFRLVRTRSAIAAFSCVADLNNDGLPDLCATGGESGSVHVYSNEGQGVFRLRHSVVAGRNVHEAAAGDLNGDGTCDLAVAGRGPDGRYGVLILRNSGHWTFPVHGFVEASSNARGVALADLDGDGDLDLATANVADGMMNTALNDGTGAFTIHQQLLAGDEPTKVMILDVDNDEDLDVVVRTYSRGISLFRNGLVSSAGGGTTNVPAEFELFANYPNPFNPSTMITFALPAASRVRLEVYNTIGQRVEVLKDGAMDAGTHQVRWESHAPAGIYWCRMRAETTGGERVWYDRTMKMVLIR